MSFTVDQWCQQYRVGKWKLYKLWKEGRGPRFYLNGPRRIISDEAAANWIRQQEAEAQTSESLAALGRASEKGRALVLAKREAAP